MTITSLKDRVRLLISDVGGSSGDDFVFTDSEIETFLSMEGDVVYAASAMALRTLAANEALVSKRIQFLELKTDGPAVAKALRELASEFDQKAEDGEGASEIFEVVPISDTIFARRNYKRIGW